MKPKLVTIGRMKQIFPRASSGKNIFFPDPNLIWGFLALVAWTGAQFWHARTGIPSSPWTYLKGVLVLLGAATIYRLSSDKGFSFLGLFPLLWLAVSSFQWDLCAADYFYYWLWLVLFLISEVFILGFPDGKKLFWFLIPFWVLLAWLFPFSFLLPLVFITAPRSRFKQSPWIRWGGLLAALTLIVLFRGWRSFNFDWVGLYDILVSGRFIVFLLLGWLGLIAFPKKGTFRHAVFPVFFLTVGFLFWRSLPPVPVGTELLKWTLVFFAGFGWESFRKDLMDPTWHGTLVWAALGLAIFDGVL